MLQVNEQEPFWHTGCAWTTVVVHAWPQAMQWFAFTIVSTHDPLQSVGIEAGQPVAHANVLPDPAQTGLVLGHAMPQAPQLSVFEMSVSQPSSGFIVQWVQGAAHAETANPHFPAAHVTVPLTCARVVQS